MFATDSCVAHHTNFTLANAGRTIHVGFAFGIHASHARHTPRKPTVTHIVRIPSAQLFLDSLSKSRSLAALIFLEK